VAVATVSVSAGADAAGDAIVLVTIAGALLYEWTRHARAATNAKATIVRKSGRKEIRGFTGD
jgi:hypothetical protein